MEPIRSARPLRNFAVYDFEWAPTFVQRGELKTPRMRLAGYYDGNRYWSFPTVEKLLEHILTRDNHGKWFFAHYGGNADIQYIIDIMVHRTEYHVKAIFSGSAAIMVTIKHKRLKLRWVFLDSFFLLRTRLEKIGEKLGMYKTGPTDDMTEYQRMCYYADVPIAELTDYNEQDCKILYEAIEQLENTLLALGGQLRITIASTALDLFLRKYLKEPLPVTAALNRWAREAYVASRVEVLQREATNALYYDINSSFPFSFTYPLPGRIIDIRSTIPKKGLYLADVTIKIPDSVHIPPLPYRTEEHIFFPTGEWRNYFFQSDIDVLHQSGGQIQAVGDVVVFEPFGDLSEYANDIYEHKRQAEGFQREVFKLLLNALYGKFAEREEKQTFHFNPPPEIISRLEERDELELERLKKENPDWSLDPVYGGGKPFRRNMIRPGQWIEKRKAFISHSHVVLSAATTSYSRQWLWEWMHKANECYYCDTDGLAVDNKTIFPTGDGLGELKLEKVLEKGVFVQPKFYEMTTDKGKVIHKAKGFSLGKTDKERAANFKELMEGREIDIVRMRRLRENLSRGTTVPVEVLVPKRLQNPVEKRCFDSEGKSRPWTVEEVNHLTSSDSDE